MEGTKLCPFCAENIQAAAIKCRFCGQWLTQPPPGAATAGVAGAYQPSSIYNPTEDLRTLTGAQRAAFKRHQLTSTFDTAVAVILGILTLNIFWTIHFLLKHGKLPQVVQDDPTAGKAIGYLFIPLYNIYWFYFAWTRLVDRINFQFRLRDMAPPVSRELVVLLLVTTFCCMIPFVGLICAAVNWLVIVPIFSAKLQGAINTLASMPREL